MSSLHVAASTATWTPSRPPTRQNHTSFGVAAMNWKQVIKNRSPWATSRLKWVARRMLAALSAHWRAALRAFLWLLLNIDPYVSMFECKLLPRGRELGQQVWPDCLVKIYQRAHLGDWCVVTWRDCTWWVGVFVSTAPTPRQGRAHAAAIRPTWATWRGLLIRRRLSRAVAGVALGGRG
jgi:hypothetical protein